MGGLETTAQTALRSSVWSMVEGTPPIPMCGAIMQDADRSQWLPEPPIFPKATVIRGEDGRLPMDQPRTHRPFSSDIEEAKPILLNLLSNLSPALGFNEGNGEWFDEYRVAKSDIFDAARERGLLTNVVDWSIYELNQEGIWSRFEIWERWDDSISRSYLETQLVAPDSRH